MLLEQKITEVSNRYSLFSIDKAIIGIQTLPHLPSLNNGNAENNKEDKQAPEEKNLDNDNHFNSKKCNVIEYSFAEEHFANELYHSQSLDYEKLFAEEKIRAQAESKVDYEASSDNTATETMSMEEAEEMTERYQFAVVLGALGDISYGDRRRFAVWADFNPVERELFHKQYAMTSNVNYSNVF